MSNAGGNRPFRCFCIVPGVFGAVSIPGARKCASARGVGAVALVWERVERRTGVWGARVAATACRVGGGNGAGA